MSGAQQNSGRTLKRMGNALRLLPFLACAVLVLALSMRDGRGTQAAEPITEGITYTTADSEGRPTEFTLPRTPERVLVSYPGATELLIDLGLTDRIIGTIAPYGAEPPAYADAYAALPILAAPYVPSREEVVALRPDLIIGWSHHFTPDALGDVYAYFDRGVGAYIVPATVRKGRPTFEETVYPFIADIGHIFGVEDRAKDYTAGLEARVAAVEHRTEARGRRFSAMILQSHGTSLYSMYGPAYIIDDIARKAGADNIVDRQMRRVGIFLRSKHTRARERPTERLRRQIFERNCAVSIGSIRRRISEGDPAHRPFRRRQFPRDNRRRKRPLHVKICRHSPLIGAVRENAVNGEILRTHSEIKIRCIRIEPNRPVHTRALLRRLRCRSNENCALIEAQC